MKIAVCSAQPHDRHFLTANAAREHELPRPRRKSINLFSRQNEVTRELVK